MEEWTDADWRDFIDSCWSRTRVLGTESWSRICGILLGIILIVWGWWRRRKLFQFIEQH
jgi:hypothetical protein